MLSFPTLCVHAVIKNFFFLASRLQLNPHCHFWWAVCRIFTVRCIRWGLVWKHSSCTLMCTHVCLKNSFKWMNECTGNDSGYSESLSGRLFKEFTELYGYNSTIVWVILIVYISSEMKMLIYIFRHSVGSSLVYFFALQ